MANDFYQLPADSTGKKLRTISETIGANEVHNHFTVLRREPTFFATTLTFADALTNGLKLFLTILNRLTTKVVRIHSANVYTSSAGATAAALVKLALERITFTEALRLNNVGTAITPTKMDTNDSVTFNDNFNPAIDVVVESGAAVTTVREIKRIVFSTDEPVVTTLDMDAYHAEVFPRKKASVFKHHFYMAKPFALRTNGTTHEGITWRGLDSTAGGLMAFEFLFSVDDQ